MELVVGAIDEGVEVLVVIERACLADRSPYCGIMGSEPMRRALAGRPSRVTSSVKAEGGGMEALVFSAA